MHRTIEPTILYFRTPVALISTLNEDGTPNIAPMSSAWWLGWRHRAAAHLAVSGGRPWLAFANSVNNVLVNNI